MSVLLAIRVLHTVIWIFFVSCILAIPVLGVLRRFRPAFMLTVLVLLECVVVALNRRQCPLTNLAAHYTADRRPNFDIYLPVWLARNNHFIFGTFFSAWSRVCSREMAEGETQNRIDTE